MVESQEAETAKKVAVVQILKQAIGFASFVLQNLMQHVNMHHKLQQARAAVISKLPNKEEFSMIRELLLKLATNRLD